MKLPKWNGVSRPSVYVFMLACFVVGFGVMTVFSLGRIGHDEREGPGWNPVSRMPDGRIGLSQSAIELIGFVAMGVGLALFLGLALLWRNYRLG